MLHPGPNERKYQYRVNRVIGVPGSMEEKDNLELQDLVKAGAFSGFSGFARGSISNDGSDSNKDGIKKTDSSHFSEVVKF